MNALACYLFVLSVLIAPIHGKPQLSNQEAIIGKTLSFQLHTKLKWKAI